ncbi:hypothetical protein [Actinokineospora terrae]|uniref:Excreted virulence factor EspC, type VII ESX diderm n=1 Tax=Actinokineospora terrae TaxID=155974 RepID=A0A1H9XDC3_9PSEU|nr:hypothetical protein [Actinokineospora terrae]SES44124.1 hypothetical protein SAMN04487818_114100 [Actinokineospora terrae]
MREQNTPQSDATHQFPVHVPDGMTVAVPVLGALPTATPTPAPTPDPIPAPPSPDPIPAPPVPDPIPTPPAPIPPLPAPPTPPLPLPQQAAPQYYPQHQYAPQDYGRPHLTVPSDATVPTAFSPDLAARLAAQHPANQAPYTPDPSAHPANQSPFAPDAHAHAANQSPFAPDVSGQPYPVTQPPDAWARPSYPDATAHPPQPSVNPLPDATAGPGNWGAPPPSAGQQYPATQPEPKPVLSGPVTGAPVPAPEPLPVPTTPTPSAPTPSAPTWTPRAGKGGDYHHHRPSTPPTSGSAPDYGKPAPGGGNNQPPDPKPGTNPTAPNTTPGHTEPGSTTPADATSPSAGRPDGAGPVQPTNGTTQGFWKIDPDQLAGFTRAVQAARFGLEGVQLKVDGMDGKEPKLGTSPVGEQLARKFGDRLNGPNGLKTLLDQAMMKMDGFIESAERVRDSYLDVDDTARGDLQRRDPSSGGTR